MPAFIVGLFLSLVGTFVGRVITALGMSLVTYQGVQLVFDKLRQLFEHYVAQLPADWIGIMGLLKIGTCFSILLSAMMLKAVISGVNNGSFKKFVIK